MPSGAAAFTACTPMRPCAPDPVLDDHGLIERDAQVLGNEPRQGIARAAGGEREDEPHGLAAELGAGRGAA